MKAIQRGYIKTDLGASIFSFRAPKENREFGAKLLVDELLPLVPVRQFVITFPVQLRLWMARSKSLCAKVCEKVCAELTAHLQHASGIKNGLSGGLGQIMPIVR